MIKFQHQLFKIPVYVPPKQERQSACPSTSDRDKQNQYNQERGVTAAIFMCYNSETSVWKISPNTAVSRKIVLQKR